MAQVVDGLETRYTLDMAASLEQVLVEETDGVATTYLYGLGITARLSLFYLEGYKGTGPGPGVANVHTPTAKMGERYFEELCPNERMLLPSYTDVPVRQYLLLFDEVNIRYTAAILKEKADLRKGSGGKYNPGSHLTDLDDVDMAVI